MERPAAQTVSLASTALGQVEADLLVVPAFEDDDFADVPGLDLATGGEIGRARMSRELTGKPFELFLTPATSGWRVRRIALIGAGPRAAYGAEPARRLASAGLLAARQRHASRVALVHRGGADQTAPERSVERLIQALAEGAVLAVSDTGRCKTSAPELGRVAEISILAPGLSPGERDAADRAVARGSVLGACTNLARDLGNEPANLLTPRAFADRARQVAEGTALSVEILDEEAIAALGMGLLLGVARGSAEPPRVVVLRHEPAGAPNTPVLGLVGKGITFDTGGISIKPADGMDHMKVDMAGGAAVIAALRAASLLGAPIRVVGVVPMTENMPGGRAVKPGDVLTGAAGKTVEVINTDAEGRLILGDGLWYARELGATHLVDVATLTGACVVALGRFHSGLFGRPDAFVEAARRLGALTGDRVWPLPASDEYFEQLKSDTADMSNTGGRPGGAVTAAVFLKQFAGDLPWLRLDIAGTARAEEARPWQAKGATGVAVRLLAELALSPEAWVGRALAEGPASR
jgi:leucyl aminopeptidase